MDEQRNLMKAATWGIWTWIAVTVVPLALVVLCCVGCLGAGIIGSAGDVQ